MAPSIDVTVDEDHFGAADEPGRLSLITKAVARAREALRKGSFILFCVEGRGSLCNDIERRLSEQKTNPKFKLVRVPDPSELPDPPASPAAPAKPQKSDWKGRLSFARLVISGTAAALPSTNGMSVRSPITPEGGIAWPISGGDQWQTAVTFGIAAGWGRWQQSSMEKISAWLGAHGWFSTDPKGDPASTGRSIVKKMIMSAGYAVLMQAGEVAAHGLEYLATGQPGALSELHKTVAFTGLLSNPIVEVARGAAVSALTQNSLTTVNRIIKDNRIAADPEHAYYYKRWFFIAGLAQSAAMSYFNALNRQPGLTGWTGFGLAVATGIGGAIAQYHVDPAFRQALKDQVRALCDGLYAIFGAAD